MSHTKEPWAAYKDGKSEMNNVSHFIKSLAGDLITYGHLSDEDASRIVACVNACTGIPTYQLTAEGGMPNSLGEMIDTLRKQCDELLDALEGLHHVCTIALSGKGGVQHTYFETRAGHFVEATGAMESAEHAIASVKGGAA